MFDRVQATSFFNVFLDDISTIIAIEAAGAIEIKGYEWSDSLAMSASMFLKDMEGCNLVPD